MKKSFRILLHTGFWLGYLIFIAIIMFAASQGQDLDFEGDRAYYLSFIFGVAILPAVFSFYAHYFYLFPKYLQQRKIVLSILVGLAICILGTSLGLLSIRLTNAEATECIIWGFPYAAGFTLLIAAVFV